MKLEVPCFLIGMGEVQWGALGTTATNTPIVPAAGDYDDGKIGGIMTGRGNRSTRRKPLSTTNPTCLPGHEPGPPQWEASD
jgi:hypothetical protein